MDCSHLLQQPHLASRAADDCLHAGSVSVAMCTFNGSRYLSEQLESIACQTLRPAEMVVCDDGSQDDTLALLENFAVRMEFPVRIYRNERNLGSTKNFEQAIGLCRGEFIALCDQDDWWSPAKLETLAAELLDSKAGGLFSDGMMMDEGSRLTGETLWGVNRFSNKNGRFNWSSERTNAISVLLRFPVVTGATLIFRSSLREQMLPFPKEWVHDGWIAWMLVLHSRLRAVAKPLIRYRLHGSQQVGLPGRSAAARLRRARATGMREYREIQRQFEVLLEYARTHPDLCEPELYRRILDKCRHMSFRADLPGNHLTRWVRIAAEASAYRLYSQGWQSMLKDALV
jgi:glycosyltransferase involved in cell wall biosynthesis